MATHIRTKNDVIHYIEDCAPSRAIVRALQEGVVEYLGGFKHIPPLDLPGWITRVTSTHNKTWFIAILADDVGHCYKYTHIEFIPWKNWVGTVFWDKDKFADKLFSGDNPLVYKELRECQNKEAE